MRASEVRTTQAECLNESTCRFFEQAGFEHVSLRTADGALEAAPAMGAADIILDLVSTGVTLRENNLKEVKGGDIMHVCFPLSFRTLSSTN